MHLTGVLESDAKHCRTTDDLHLLLLRMVAPGGGKGRAMVIRATKPYGTGNSAGYACRARASTLRRGVRITLGGAGLRPCRGGAELEAVDYLHAPDLDIHRQGNSE